LIRSEADLPDLSGRPLPDDRFEPGETVINGDREWVASDLAVGAAQVMAGMARYPALLRVSPWELDEEMEDRETIPCARNLGLADVNTGAGRMNPGLITHRDGIGRGHREHHS
jgi:hypothetical protein